MSKQSVINVNRNAPTTIDFNVGIDGVDDVKNTRVELYIESVMDQSALAIKATHTKGDEWSVTIPKLDVLSNDTYNVQLNVVVDGYFFTPAKGTMKMMNGPAATNEGINSGSDAGIPGGPGVQIGTNKLGPEFPIEYKIDDKANQSSNIHPRLGDNSADHIDDAILDNIAKPGEPKAKTPKQGTPISDIASRVNGVSGPQLTMDDVDDKSKFDAKEIAAQIIRNVVPHVKESVIPQRRRLLTPNDIQRIIKDPVVEAERQERSAKIRKAIKG